MAVAFDCVHLFLYPAEAVQTRVGVELPRAGPESAQGLCGDDAGDAERHPAKVARRDEALVDAEHLAHRSRKHPDAGDACASDADEHPLWNAICEDLLLEWEAVDQERR